MISLARGDEPRRARRPRAPRAHRPGLHPDRVHPAPQLPGAVEDPQGRAELARGAARQAPVEPPGPDAGRAGRRPPRARRRCSPRAGPTPSTAARGTACTCSSATRRSAPAPPRCRRTSSPTGPSSSPGSELAARAIASMTARADHARWSPSTRACTTPWEETAGFDAVVADRRGGRPARLPPPHVQRARRRARRRHRGPARAAATTTRSRPSATSPARTTRIRFETHVLVLGYHHPFALAKRYGTLDAISGGRLILGVGVGSLEEEFALLGRAVRRSGPTERDESLARAAPDPRPAVRSTASLIDPCAVQEHVPDLDRRPYPPFACGGPSSSPTAGARSRCPPPTPRACAGVGPVARRLRGGAVPRAARRPASATRPAPASGDRLYRPGPLAVARVTRGAAAGLDQFEPAILTDRPTGFR